jgi:transcriptional regulator EpsA
MNTVQAVPRWMGAVVQGTPFSTWSARDSVSPSRTPSRNFQLGAEEGARFLRIVSECGRIRRHCDIYRWLAADVQYFLPHEILLSAWGDFDEWKLKLDLVSALPGLRTNRAGHCGLEALARRAYARWCDAGREPLIMEFTGTDAEHQACACPVHSALRGMRHMLVHGVHDKRSGSGALYIALACEPIDRGQNSSRFLAMVDPLVAQMDAAFRRVPALSPAEVSCAPESGSEVLELSEREVEVLESLRRGKTNLDIAVALNISPFTVKNHVQRIFRKIGVRNRTQAAARYGEALRRPPLQADAMHAVGGLSTGASASA